MSTKPPKDCSDLLDIDAEIEKELATVEKNFKALTLVPKEPKDLTAAEKRSRDTKKELAELLLPVDDIAEQAAMHKIAVDPLESRLTLEAMGWFGDLAKISERNASQVLAYVQRLFNLSFLDSKAFQKTLEDYKRIAKREKLSLNVEVSESDDATYDDYVAFINNVFASPRRCLLSGNLMTWDSVLEKYVPCLNRISTLKSRLSEFPGLKMSMIEQHFLRYQSEVKPELLIEIPQWDGRDRLLEIATCLLSVNVLADYVYHAMCDWGAKAWRRLFDSRVRNKILTFLGPQNIGKDWLIEALTAGFDLPGLNYVRSTVIDDNGEINQQLHRAIVFRIEEFDRSSKTSVSQIKHVVTAFNTSERLKYDREAESRDIRASFIASANPTDILRDPTGNDRFLIVQLASIKFEYPGAHGSPNCTNDRLQIIAQYKALAEAHYQMPDDALRAFKEFNEKMSPDDENTMLVDEFDRLCQENAEFNPLKYGEWFNKKEMPQILCDDIFEKLSISFGIKRGAIQRRLTGAGRRKRRADGVYYLIVHRPKFKIETNEQL